MTVGYLTGMNYFDKLKAKFEQLSTSQHSGGQADRGNTGGGQPTFAPNQAPYPPQSVGPGGFFVPPQSQGYGGQGYPNQGAYPPSQAPYPQEQQYGGPSAPPKPARADAETARQGPPSNPAQTSKPQGRQLDGIPLALDQHDIFPTKADGSRTHVGEAPKGSMQFLNIEQNELLHQRFVIVYGQVHGVHGANDRIIVRHAYFPPLTFPAVDGYFKVMAELENGSNELRFEYLQNDACVGTGTLTLRMAPDLEKPPLLLAVILGKDSEGTFDAPPQSRGPGRNDLDAAVRKFRCTAYMWQAFMAEQLHRQGFGRRTFRLEENYESDTMARDGERRMTARVHVVRSKRTVAEIRDKERAQQWKAPDGYKRHTDESQFGLANEALNDYGVFQGKHFIVCLTADAQWDAGLGVILGHAALGGGIGDRRLGVFGSHTTHAWPANAEEIAEKFLDTTKTDTRYVANDANECGEHWRAANIGMGAFLHECGHLLTLAHTPSGIMSRGFNDYNRTFMARSPNINGAVRQRDEAGAHWHRTDIVRLRHHFLLRQPTDAPLRENERDEAGFELLPIDNGVLVRSTNGITMVEAWVGGRYRNHMEFTKENLPRRMDGSLPAYDAAEAQTEFPTQVLITEHRLRQLAGDWPTGTGVTLVLTSRAMSTGTFDDVLALSRNARRDNDGIRVFSAAMLGRGEMKGSVKGEARFAAKHIRASSLPRLRRIEVRSGNYVDGVVFHMSDGSKAQIGTCAGGGRHMLEIADDDDLDHVVVNCGWWIDGLEFVTARGRRSGWHGGRGGSKHVLQPPPGYAFMGLSGSGASWLDSLSMRYARVE
ncbi:hypothetical protein LPJ77_001531 [Coemansia sp. RSA 2523]|nr:hypothetical protein LPJ54_001078 [Coemansia sp. RSA 1824]KAJ1809595.1 hypothetical protein LPJ77_001531 [Coemansia sp. RSA 2523]